MERVNRMILYLQKELNLDERDASIVKYGLEVLVTSISGFTAIVIMGWMLGVLKYALIAALAASLLRILTGGAHSNSLFNCSLLGAIVSPGIGLIAKNWGTLVSDLFMFFLSAFTFLFALVTVWLYAPADTPSKPITRPEQIKKLRALSLGYIAVWATINFLALAQYIIVLKPVLLVVSLSIIWQSFSITPAGYRFVGTLDRVLPELKFK